MDLLIAEYSVSLASADSPPVSGTPQYATDGDPATNTPPTVWPSYWFNGLQKDLVVGLIQGVGITPDRTVSTQVAQAIKRLAGGNVTGLTANATLTADNAGIVLVNATAGSIAITLPAASSANGVPIEFLLLRTDATANQVTVAPAGTDAFLPSGSTTALSLGAGAQKRLVSDGSGHWVVPGAGLAHGECFLSAPSSTSLKLSPRDGNNIIIDGTQYQIPSAGITVTSAGLSASTLYYVYLYNNSGTLTLELSTTGHATDTTAGNIGVEIKSGDSSRTLIAMLFVNASSHFASSQQSQNIVNWFNRSELPLNGSGVNASTSSTTYVALGSSALVEFCTWNDGACQFQVGGQVSGDTAGAVASLTLLTDGATSAQGISSNVTIGTVGSAYACADQFSSLFAEGHHTVTPGGLISAGSATYNVAIAGAVRG